MIGEIIDNYKIIKLIGSGGMGTVYLAEDIMLGRQIAIKMLHPELLFKKDIIERFKAEAKLLAKLNHPNIAILFNLIESSGNYFMIMEYVDGYSLETMLSGNGAIEVDEAIDIMVQALEGIEHAHHKQIIHRDLKPANLMINRDNIVKVMDFGIARALGSARLTREGSVVGTLEYMAPEQIQGFEGDVRTDIYAMGVVLYELLTGNVPYQSESDYDLMTKKLNQKPPKIRSFLHEIPKSLEKVVMKSINKNPDLRFQSAGQFKDALQKCKSDLISGIKTKNKKTFKNSLGLPRKNKMEILKNVNIIPGTKNLFKGILLIIFIFIIGISAYFLRQKRLENQMIVANEKQEITNDFSEHQPIDADIANSDMPDENNKLVSGVSINPDDLIKKNKKNKNKQEDKNKLEAKNRQEDKKKKANKKKDIRGTNINKDEKMKSSKKDKKNKIIERTGNHRDKKEKNKENTENAGGKNSMVTTKEKNKTLGKNTNKENTEKKIKTEKKNNILKTFIKKNMPVIITLPEQISSSDVMMEGQSIMLYVDKDYTENDIVIIPAGSKVYCTVNDIKKAEGRKRGTIEIEAHYIVAGDGTHVPLKESVFRYVGKRGQNVKYKKGQKFKVKTAKKTNITIKY